MGPTTAIDRPDTAILPSRAWPTGLHSHFAKTTPSSELCFQRYAESSFEDYGGLALEKTKRVGLAAWAVTDYTFDPVRWAATLYPDRSLTECAKAWEQAARESAERHSVPGQFVALAGFEYGRSINFLDLSRGEQRRFKDRKNYKGHVDSFGDIVIHNAPFLSPTQGRHDIQNLLELSEVYRYIADSPGAFGIFAHPKGYPDGKGNNFNNLELFEAAAGAMVGFEIWNGASAYYKHCDFLWEYLLALRKGWKVGAVYSSDNNWPNWGEETYDGVPLGFTMVLQPEPPESTLLCREAVYAQLRRRRFYGSLSPNLQLGLMTEEGAVMGDTLTTSKPTTIFVCASGADVQWIRTIQSTVGSRCVVSIHPTPYTCDTTYVQQVHPPPAGNTAFFLVELLDRNQQFMAHSSPIWFMNPA